MAREITISDLKSKVDAGWKKQVLADHYGLPMAQMTKLLQTAGLKIRKFHAPLYVLVDDTVVGTTENDTMGIEEMAVSMETQEVEFETPEVEEAPIIEEEQVVEPASEMASQTW